jgi:hypothetical protein
VGGSFQTASDAIISNNLLVGNEINVQGVTNLNDTNIYGKFRPNTIPDYFDSSGNSGQILTSTTEHLKWKNLPNITGGTNIMVDNSNYNPIINMNITSDLNLNNKNITNINTIYSNNILKLASNTIDLSGNVNVTSIVNNLDISGNVNIMGTTRYMIL